MLIVVCAALLDLTRLAQNVLKACESTVKPALQKYLTTIILSPISSNSDLHQHCYTLIYQVRCWGGAIINVFRHSRSLAVRVT